MLDLVPEIPLLSGPDGRQPLELDGKNEKPVKGDYKCGNGDGSDGKNARQLIDKTVTVNS